MLQGSDQLAASSLLRRTLTSERDGDGRDEGASAEHGVEPLGVGGELQPLDPGGEHEDRQHRAPHVEAAGDDLRGAEKDRGEGRQQQGPAVGQGRTGQRGVDRPVRPAMVPEATSESQV